MVTGTKRKRIAITSLLLVLLGPVCGAFAASTDGDQRMLEVRQKFPANSFVVMEAKLFEGESTVPKICQTMNVTIKSDSGQTTTILSPELFYFDKVNNTFGGGAVLAPGTYTI